MGLSNLQYALGISALNDIVNDEREEIERLEYEKRKLEDEIEKMKPSSPQGPWTKKDQENFELNWHSLGYFDLNGKKAENKEPTSDFSEFIW